MRVMLVMRNQDISVILKMLKIIKIFMRALYMMFSPLIMVINILLKKVMNLLRKDRTNEIKIHLLQCMLKFQNIKSKI